jgi:membrane-associated phospholipid phosphatase
VVYLVRRHRVTDFHIPIRSQRIRPMLFMVGMSILMVIAMLILHPPLLVIWITAGSVLQLLAIFLITLKWKISGHAAAISTLSVLMVLFFGSAALTAFLLVPIVVWARLRLRRHTPLQTVAGTALGLSLLLGVTLLF